MQKIVLASGNPGKLKELQATLQPLQLNLIPQSQFALSEAAETATTFVENALIKAHHAAKATRLPALADDSGLCINALNGQPGIISARYAGEPRDDKANISKVLAECNGVANGHRQAQFHCVIVYLRHPLDPIPIICHGVWHGTILSTPRGLHGFGYDPIFYVPSHQCSAAELDAETKNTISHRAQAVTQLVDYLHER